MLEMGVEAPPMERLSWFLEVCPNNEKILKTNHWGEEVVEEFRSFSLEQNLI